MNEIIRLQTWFRSQCNGDWEHEHGVSIMSCDNPGWWVKIDLRGTHLAMRPFPPVERNMTVARADRIAKGLELDNCEQRKDWMLCQVKNGMFDGSGDTEKLQAILSTFLTWAEVE
jgi:hypothetical protein